LTQVPSLHRRSTSYFVSISAHFNQSGDQSGACRIEHDTNGNIEPAQKAATMGKAAEEGSPECQFLGRQFTLAFDGDMARR
jgi:hypothetical protein